MTKKFLLSFGFLVIFLLLPGFIQAVCPLCMVTVGAGIGLSRWLGIDDVISGVWVGGLIVSFILWTLGWLNKRGIRFKFLWLIISIFFYLIILIPLYLTDIIGHPFNKIFGIDKLLFGIISGSPVFLLSVLFHDFLKKKNQGKSFFPFQRIVIPVLFLLLASFILYLIR